MELADIAKQRNSYRKGIPESTKEKVNLTKTHKNMNMKWSVTMTETNKNLFDDLIDDPFKDSSEALTTQTSEITEQQTLLM